MKRFQHRKQGRPQGRPQGRERSTRRDIPRAGEHESLVLGRNAVREVVRFAPERVKRGIFAAGQRREGDELAQLFEGCGIAVEYVALDELSKLAGTDSHQGCIAVVSPREHPDLPTFIDSLESAPRACVLVLDEINDPQNLGAILRAAECFGVAGVVYSRNRGTGVTPVVTKASAGASELVTLVAVSNVADAVRKLKEAHFWVVAADSAEGGESLERFSFPERSVLVMGSEGRGVQRLLLDLSDFRVRIPMVGKVDSLNVSQATAVCLYQYKSSIGR